MKKKDTIARDSKSSSKKQRWREEIVSFVKEELVRRQKEKLVFELQWQLNSNFIMGNQYCDYNLSAGRLYNMEKLYEWEQKEVFNHLAPILETRMAKLGRLRPIMTTRPASGDRKDIAAARVCNKVLKASCAKLNLGEMVQQAISWSETTGTVFYKSVWNPTAGREIALTKKNTMREGDLNFSVVSPFEIFPDSPFNQEIDDCRSIIHAKAYSSAEVEDNWDINIKGSSVNIFSLGASPVGSGGLGYSGSVRSLNMDSDNDKVLVIEYYERPSKDYPEGRFIMTAGDQLIYQGSLNWFIGNDLTPDFPFVKQVCIRQSGCFWGVSVIERCIPIQRAYNSVKNRKHEYLNRVALGILEVEDGSVDIDDLRTEGLYPGKIILKTPGSAPIRFVENGHLPSQFEREEDKLLDEFILISGVSELARNSSVPSASAGSGVALDILREMDDTRLSLTAEHIRNAIKTAARQWIRLYRQFAIGDRIDRLTGAGERASVFNWSKSDLTTDDIVFETENELTQTPAQRRQMIFNLLDRGFFTNSQTGAMDGQAKARVLKMLDLSSMDADDDLTGTHLKKAKRENDLLELGESPQLSKYDDHAIHLSEHVRFALSGDYEILEKEENIEADILDKHIDDHQMILDEFKMALKSEAIVKAEG